MIHSPGFPEGSVGERERKNLVLKGRKWGVKHSITYLPPLGHLLATEIWKNNPGKRGMVKKNEAFLFLLRGLRSLTDVILGEASITSPVWVMNVFSDILPDYAGEIGGSIFRVFVLLIK